MSILNLVLYNHVIIGAGVIILGQGHPEYWAKICKTFLMTACKYFVVLSSVSESAMLFSLDLHFVSSYQFD